MNGSNCTTRPTSHASRDLNKRYALYAVKEQALLYFVGSSREQTK